jgi:hypothetical protein
MALTVAESMEQLMEKGYLEVCAYLFRVMARNWLKTESLDCDEEKIALMIEAVISNENFTYII